MFIETVVNWVIYIIFNIEACGINGYCQLAIRIVIFIPGLHFRAEINAYPSCKAILQSHAFLLIFLLKSTNKKLFHIHILPVTLRHDSGSRSPCKVLRNYTQTHHSR